MGRKAFQSPKIYSPLVSPGFCVGDPGLVSQFVLFSSWRLYLQGLRSSQQLSPILQTWGQMKEVQEMCQEARVTTLWAPTSSTIKWRDQVECVKSTVQYWHYAFQASEMRHNHGSTWPHFSCCILCQIFLLGDVVLGWTLWGSGLWVPKNFSYTLVGMGCNLPFGWLQLLTFSMALTLYWLLLYIYWLI